MKHLLKSMTLCVMMLLTAAVAMAQGDVTAKWDFKNDLPEGIQAATNYQKTTVDIPSTVEGVSMHVDATKGKLYCVGRNNAQFNENTVLQVPVKSTRDVVVVENYPTYQSYTIGGVAATADVNEHRATTDEVAKGYVEIVATATVYLYSVQVTFVSAVSVKELYSTDFSTWGAYEQKADDKNVTNVEWKTKYSHENLTFSIFNTQIGATNFNTGKFPDWTGGMLMCAKSDNPYVETSALASVTKVHFRHGATGGNRGWKLLAKGDGDADWVVVSSSVANPAQGCDVDVDVNKTNCKLRFENITTNQNAYLLELAIYGLVDLSKTPALGKITVNGVDYQTADICGEDNDGNMCATIEISKKEKMVDKDSNPVIFGTPDNGDIQSVEYTKVDDNSTLVTVVVTAGNQTLTYKFTVAFKPDYTLTYYNTDGSVLEATQQVEKDSPIATLRNNDGVIVADGKAFRGWFVEADGGRKYTTDDIVTGPTSLYAVATDIEVASDVNRYTYTLTDQYFYAEDHEGFRPTGGAFHDKQHGWAFGADDKIDIISGRHSLIFVTGCKYSNASTIKLMKGETEVGSITLDKNSDGVMQSIEYTGEAGTLTLVADGGMYMHKLVVANLGDASTEKNELGYYVCEAGNAG
ncbi:InlB B-repeat-containing protein, partial [Prevotella sp.]|uniref:InlB B-repeat-containing protein n=1 Tax=Prevotella sp. TaxID=59823 RepID=UPI00307CE53F